MWQPGYSAKASLNFWLLVMTCASASAADLAPAAPLPPLPWAQASWTGFYVGAGGGLSSLNNKINAQPGPDPSSPLSASLNGLGATGTLASEFDARNREKAIPGSLKNPSLPHPLRERG